MSGSKSRLPRDEVPEPALVLLGCQPLRPSISRDEPCPVCKGLIGQPRQTVVGDEVLERPDPLANRTYCGQCDAVSPANERRCVGAIVRLISQGTVEAADNQAKASMHKHGRTLLSEKDRRLIWNGYRGSLLAPAVNLTNRIKTGRAWLTKIGQCPDFGLKINKRGKVVGRLDDPEPGAA